MLVSSLLAGTRPIDVVDALVRADLRTSEPAVARCIASAGDVARALSVATWSVIEPALGLSDHRRHAAEALGRRIADALAQNEHVVPIGPALQAAQGQASRLLAEAGSPPRPTPPPEPPPHRPPADDGFDEPNRPVPPFEPIFDADEVIDERSAESLDARAAARLLDDLRAMVDQTPGARLTLTWRVTRRGGDEA